MDLSLNSIYGQLRVKENLSKIIQSKRIPHALLFSGPDGVGKFNSAIKFTQLLNIDSPAPILKKIETIQEPYIKLIMPLPRGKNEANETSGTEKLSKEIIEFIQEETEKKIGNPYYKILIPDANNVKISSIREIKKFLSMQYLDIKHRVIIILDAHLMSDDAQNALLKSLEEPPDGVIFILITPFKNLLFETILSRCWNINFEPLEDSDVAEILHKHFGLDQDLSNKAAPFASGSVTQALEIIENDFNLLLEKTITVLRYSLALKHYSAFKEIQPILADTTGKKFQLLLKMIIIWLNDVQREKINFNNYFFQNHLDTIEKFNLRFEVDLSKLVNSVEKIFNLVDSNLNINILAFNLIQELSSLRHFNYKKS